MFVNCISRRLEARALRRSVRATRNREREAARYARIKLCPNCFVPIEKNEGCDHMHCLVCGTDFSWRNAMPWDYETHVPHIHNERFRLCPFCHQQNEKLHNLSQARCSRCRRDFEWERAVLAPMPQFRLNVNDTAGPPIEIMEPRNHSNDCGAIGSTAPEISPALRRWLEQHQPIDLDEGDEVTADVPEFLKCDICSQRRKSVALPCGHLFCEACVVTFLRDNPVCPVDRIVVQTPPMKVYL